MIQTSNTLALNIKKQPDDVTCGPTCLHAVYDYFGDSIELNEVIAQVKQLQSGGTLGVLLGNHALKRGYKVTIYTYNLTTFDPSWFAEPTDIAQKLTEQLLAKPKVKRLKTVTRAYQKFLQMGGEIKFQELTPELMMSFLSEGAPILTGLSATYLYESPREVGDFEIVFDDVRGFPSGHFVVINGFDNDKVFVADPLENNPISEKQYYKVSFQKLINSIMLGVMTYDANLLIIHPKNSYA